MDKIIDVLIFILYRLVAVMHQFSVCQPPAAKKNPKEEEEAATSTSRKKKKKPSECAVHETGAQKVHELKIILALSEI